MWVHRGNGGIKVRHWNCPSAVSTCSPQPTPRWKPVETQTWTHACDIIDFAGLFTITSFRNRAHAVLIPVSILNNSPDMWIVDPRCRRTPC